MGQDDPTESRESDGAAAWSRRSVIKVSGAGVGLATVGGAGLAAASGESGSDTETDGDATQQVTETAADGTATETAANRTVTEPADGGADLVEDLLDPTFGYPLAADETDEVDVSPVVELATEEGEGAYPDFPVNPDTGEALPLEFVFDPVGLRVEPGAIVEFRVRSGEHTVTAFHEKFSIPQRPVPTRVPEGIPGFSSPPILDGEAWLYEFPESGVYDVFCLPHLIAGMVMRVAIVGPDDDVESDAFAVQSPEALPGNANAVLSAPELDSATVAEAGSVAWGDLSLEPPQIGTPGAGTPGIESPTDETG